MQEERRSAMTEAIEDRQQKQRIARLVLEDLPEWFGMEESREQYIQESADQIFLTATRSGKTAGFLCLKETGKDTAEIAVMGVLKAFQRQGAGTELMEAAKRTASETGYSFLQVKTVKRGVYEEYDQTNLFYLHAGFKEFELMPNLWDPQNPCQIYVMSLT